MRNLKAARCARSARAQRLEAADCAEQCFLEIMLSVGIQPRLSEYSKRWRRKSPKPPIGRSGAWRGSGNARWAEPADSGGLLLAGGLAENLQAEVAKAKKRVAGLGEVERQGRTLIKG